MELKLLKLKKVKVSSIEADILEPQKNDFYIITPYLKLKEVKRKFLLMD